jgi:hypothetical protein
MPAYLDRFVEMVDKIKQQSNRRILSFARFPPIGPEIIERIEREYDCTLDRSVAEFFRESNGLQIRWTLTQAISDAASIGRDKQAEDHHQSFAWMLPWERRLQDTGIINILPLDKILLSDWKGFTWFGSERGSKRFLGIEYQYVNFLKMMKPFDIFGKYYTMVLFMKPTVATPLVLLAEDNLTDYSSSKITNFESYLEFLLATEGAVVERPRFYSDKWNSSEEPKQVIDSPSAYWQTADTQRDGSG